MLPVKCKLELIVPVKFMTGLGYLHFGFDPTPAFSCIYHTIMHNFVYFRAL